MTCKWTERVASYAGEDLGTRESGDVEHHLRECAACRSLLDDLIADRELLREPVAVPRSVFSEIRSAVLHRTSSPVGGWTGFAGAALAAGLAVAMWYAHDSRQPLERIEIAIAAPAGPALEAGQRVPQVLSTPGRKRSKRSAVKPPASSVALAMALRDLLEPETAAPVTTNAPIVVAAMTEDPDVIIILVPESKGERP